jgi:hypothetical protein
MATTPTTYTGEDAYIYISGQSHTVFGLGDFSLTLDRGTVEQELVGEAGNKFQQGAMSVEGSFTNAEWGNDAVNVIVGSLVNGTMVKISGSCGMNSLHWILTSCQITGFDISIGDASTVTEGSVDFVLLDPYNIAKAPYGADSGMKIYD